MIPIVTSTFTLGALISKKPLRAIRFTGRRRFELIEGKFAYSYHLNRPGSISYTLLTHDALGVYDDGSVIAGTWFDVPRPMYGTIMREGIPYKKLPRTNKQMARLGINTQLSTPRWDVSDDWVDLKTSEGRIPTRVLGYRNSATGNYYKVLLPVSEALKYLEHCMGLALRQEAK